MYIFNGNSYRCEFIQGESGDLATVCFQSWSPHPAFSVDNFAQNFVQSRKISAFVITCAKNDWYQDREFDEVVSELNRRRLPKMVGYGSSMGAYAALNYSAFLDFSHVIALCPQYSMNPEKVGFETRWREDVTGLAHNRDYIWMMKSRTPATVVYDHLFTPDRAHVDLIENNFPNMTRVSIPFAWHTPSQLLLEFGILGDAIEDMIFNRFDVRVYREKIRAKRRLSPSYYSNISRSLFDRGCSHSAVSAAERAYGLLPTSFLHASHYANLLSMLGKKDIAISVLMPFEKDPDFSRYIPGILGLE